MRWKSLVAAALMAFGAIGVAKADTIHVWDDTSNQAEGTSIGGGLYQYQYYVTLDANTNTVVDSSKADMFATIENFNGATSASFTTDALNPVTGLVGTSSIDGSGNVKVDLATTSAIGYVAAAPDQVFGDMILGVLTVDSNVAGTSNATWVSQDWNTQNGGFTDGGTSTVLAAAPLPNSASMGLALLGGLGLIGLGAVRRRARVA